MTDNQARPSVHDIVKESGVTAAELVAAAPHLSKHSLRAIVSGRISGATHPRNVAEALNLLATERAEQAERYAEAARALVEAYP